MTVAKGIGGGFPLGACLATAEAAKGMTAGTHGSTFGGNPLAMAVGKAVLDIVADPASSSTSARWASTSSSGSRRWSTPIPTSSPRCAARGCWSASAASCRSPTSSPRMRDAGPARRRRRRERRPPAAAARSSPRPRSTRRSRASTPRSTALEPADDGDGRLGWRRWSAISSTSPTSTPATLRAHPRRQPSR